MDALWSVQEIRTQAEQVTGQVDIWEAIEEAETCPKCGAAAYVAGGWWLTCSADACLTPIRRIK